MLIPIILSGGAGTRLWPVSRQSYPKPFMRIGGAKSLLLQTHERALAVSDNTQALIVTNRDYYFLSHDELVGQRIQPQYMLEPSGRNTAPAIALAALWALEKGDPCMLVMPADHLITDLGSFNAAVQEARILANEGYLVLFGIRPTAPETGDQLRTMLPSSLVPASEPGADAGGAGTGTATAGVAWPLEPPALAAVTT